MATFNYRSRGTANTTWQEGTIEAESKQDAQDKLDEIFGIQRDESGEQTNSDLIKVEVL